MDEAIWITGVGLTTPLGNDYVTFSTRLLAGESGVGPLTDIPEKQSAVRIAARVSSIPTPQGMSDAEFRALPRLDQVALSCASSALHDSGYGERPDGLRVGVVLGLGAEWLRVWEPDRLQGGTRAERPEEDRDSVAQRLAERLQLSGPITTVGAACASANYALGLAKSWLRRGWVDVCLAGGCDLVTPMSLAAFGNLRALSRKNETPQGASRPFDRNRDGFVMGEGGAVFVLERESQARRRGASVYSELAGFGASSDAAHVIIPSDDPFPASQAMGRALADAALPSSAVHYVNAHATSTSVGDRAEARSLRLVFGDAISAVPVSSTKSMTGHLLSAAAAVEALACIVAIQQQALPPTINLYEPDPECDLCHVPLHARPGKVQVAMSNSFGFGGTNTTAIFRKVA